MDGRGSAEAHTGLFSAAYRKKKSGKEKETNLVESEGGEIEEKDEEKDENGEKDNDEEVEVVEKDFEEVRNTQRGFKAKKAVNEKAKKENDGEKKYNLWVYICSPFQQRILEIRWLRNQLPSGKMKNATGRELLVIPGNGNGNHTYKIKLNSIFHFKGQ